MVSEAAARDHAITRRHIADTVRDVRADLGGDSGVGGTAAG
jgi:hypothetical protein